MALGRAYQSIAVIESIRAACLEVIVDIQLAFYARLGSYEKLDRMRPRGPGRTKSAPMRSVPKPSAIPAKPTNDRGLPVANRRLIGRFAVRGNTLAHNGF